MPAGAVDQDVGAGRNVVEPAHRDHAGNPELAGDDRGVTGRAAQCGGQADDERRVQPRGVGRREVLGAQDRGPGRHRHTGLGESAEFGDHPVPDVAQVSHPFGHQPADLGEEVDELGDRLGGGPHRGHAFLDALLGGAQPGPVLRERRGGGQDLGRRTGGTGGTRAQPLGDGGRRGGEPCGLRVPVRLGHLTTGVEVVEVGKPAGTDDGCVSNAGNHRDPGEDGSGLGAE